MRTLINKEDYFKTYILTMENEDKVTEFLNDPAIMRKFDDETREYFITGWLLANGYTEVPNDEESSTTENE